VLGCFSYVLVTADTIIVFIIMSWAQMLTFLFYSHRSVYFLFKFQSHHKYNQEVGRKAGVLHMPSLSLVSDLLFLFLPVLLHAIMMEMGRVMWAYCLD
jgi:hypothetical protein